MTAPHQPSSAPGTEMPDRATAHRTVAMLMLLLALAGIALATLGAGAERAPLGSYEGPTKGAFTLDMKTQAPTVMPTMEQDTEPPEPPPPPGRIATIAPLLLVASLAAAIVVLLVLLLRRMQALNRPPHSEADAVVQDEELTQQQARDVLADARQRLSLTVDAHDAVVAAWLALERSIAEVGIHRAASQTTLEYVVDVLGGVDLDAAELDQLAHLYRRALFDDDPLREADRDQALTLLDALTEQLDQRAASGESR